MGGEEGGHEGSNIGEIQPDLPNQNNHFVSVLQMATAQLQNYTKSLFPVQNTKSTDNKYRTQIRTVDPEKMGLWFKSLKEMDCDTGKAIV